MTYEELAARMSVRMCPDHGACPAFQRHYPGVVVQLAGQTIAHWSPRRVNKRGAFNFIRKVEAARIPPGAPVWMSIWLSTSRAVSTSLTFGYRIPRWYTDPERARVRWMLADPAKRETNEDAQRAWKWAQPE